MIEILPSHTDKIADPEANADPDHKQSRVAVLPLMDKVVINRLDIRQTFDRFRGLVSLNDDIVVKFRIGTALRFQGRNLF